MTATIVKETLTALDEIKEKGYIHPENNSIQLYSNQISHLLAGFLKKNSSSKEALACMEKLGIICQNTGAFFPLFSNSMMDLYDLAAKGEPFTKRQAETKLLFFFSHVSPETIAQKNRLLKQIQQIPNCAQREKEVAGVVKRLTNHYDQNQQFKEDPNLSVLSSLSDLLRQINKASHSKHCNGDKAQARAYLAECVASIKMRAPELCTDLSQEQFAPKPPHRHNIPDIKEAVNVSSGRHRSWNKNSSRLWDRE